MKNNILECQQVLPLTRVEPWIIMCFCCITVCCCHWLQSQYLSFSLVFFGVTFCRGSEGQHLQSVRPDRPLLSYLSSSPLLSHM